MTKLLWPVGTYEVFQVWTFIVLNQITYIDMMIRYGPGRGTRSLATHAPSHIESHCFNTILDLSASLSMASAFVQKVMFKTATTNATISLTIRSELCHSRINHVPRIILTLPASLYVIFSAIGEYSPFFIKRSELQVSYERQITNY